MPKIMITDKGSVDHLKKSSIPFLSDAYITIVWTRLVFRIENVGKCWETLWKGWESVDNQKSFLIPLSFYLHRGRNAEDDRKRMAH